MCSFEARRGVAPNLPGHHHGNIDVRVILLENPGGP